MGTGDLYRQWYALLWNIHKRNEKREWKWNELNLEKGEEEIIFKIWLGKKTKTIRKETESRKILNTEQLYPN